jgi:ABC-type multidrug transport system fused ATPase/permease subunit
MFIAMLFNPLRQIADKFNEMQLGMIANRVFAIIDTADQIQDTGTVEAPFPWSSFQGRPF